jgi:hypothetical protein
MFYLSVKIDEPAVIEDLHIKQEELNLRWGFNNFKYLLFYLFYR